MMAYCTAIDRPTSRAQYGAPGRALDLAAEPLDADARVRLRRQLALAGRQRLAFFQALADGLRPGDGAAVAADRAEQVGVPQAEHQAAVAAHRQAVDRPA